MNGADAVSSNSFRTKLLELFKRWIVCIGLSARIPQPSLVYALIFYRCLKCFWVWGDIRHAEFIIFSHVHLKTEIVKHYYKSLWFGVL